MEAAPSLVARKDKHLKLKGKKTAWLQLLNL